MAHTPKSIPEIQELTANALALSKQGDPPSIHLAISSEIAQYWLDRLTQYPEANRPRLSVMGEKAHVENLATIMAEGGWDDRNNQGFVIGHNGVLLQGRHRCLAVVKSGVTIIVPITFDDTKVTALDVKGDVNMAMRSYAYVTGLDPKIASSARFLVSFLGGKRKPSDTAVGAVGKTLTPAFVDFSSHGAQRNRTWSSGYHISAFLLRMLEAMRKGDATEQTELARIYHTFNANDPQKLSGLPYSYWRQATEKKMDQTQKFIRLWRALDPIDRATIEKLQFKNLSLTTALVRQECVRLIPYFQPPKSSTNGDADNAVKELEAAE